jgi:CheY-like chemotaxis protein
LEAPSEFDRNVPTRIELYRIFHHIWSASTAAAWNLEKTGEGLVSALPLQNRQALLLTAVEGFSVEESALILGCQPSEVDLCVERARAVIADSMAATVLIIEDEPVIAIHIKSIVEELGHSITGVARTRKEAVALAISTRPEMVLADISLADGSSGIDAVTDILSKFDIPVIFITAYPERLLTGERPEPTYLITKPFEPETVTATIGQALLFHREQRAIRNIAA